MKIAIDGYEANVPQRLGSSKVAYELIKNLEKIDKKNEYVIYLPGEPLPDMPKPRNNFSYSVLKNNKLWTYFSLPLKLFREKNKPDLFFSPTHYIPRFSPVKKIVTIFDLSFLHFPEMFKKSDLWKLKNWTKFSISNAEHIITISNSTKKDIVSTYGISKDKISVAYPGYDREKFTLLAGRQEVQSSKFKVEEIKEKYKIKNPYIIYIGTLQPRKNLIRLIEAVSRIEDLNLVVVGKTSGEGREGWMYEDILKTPVELGCEDRVIFTGFVQGEDLPFLISGAVCFILPSLWEGFGIPVLEAMACGTPVIVSNSSSLPELVGNAGLKVDPYSVDQIEQAIRTLYTDKKLRVKLSKLSIVQAKKYSWEKMAKTVLKVFESSF